MALPQNGSSEISLIGTGDGGTVHGPDDGFPIERYSELVSRRWQRRPALRNCERQYSLRGAKPEPR